MLTAKEVHFWRKNSSFKNPWDRLYLNIDYTKVEIKRIIDVFKWWKIFVKAGLNEIIKEEVCFYVLPIKPSAQLKVAVGQTGYNFVQLSALKNHRQLNLIMLFPNDKTPPDEYSLIRLNNSKKIILEVPGTNDREYVILVEDFKKEPIESIYKDIPFEKRRISKFFQENIIGDKNLIKPFQSSISGSPYINNKGGITFSNYHKGKTLFDENFFLILKQIHPPEFTDIQYYYPKKLLNGKWIKDGLFDSDILFSDKYTKGNIFYSAFNSNKNSQIDNELIHRKSFNEYSFFSPFNFSGESQIELANNIFSRIVKTEVTGAIDFKEDIYESDVYLEKAKREINEELHIQIANQKFLCPRIVDQEVKLKNLRISLIKDWKEIYESSGIKHKDIPETDSYSIKSFNNILSVAKSFARDEGTEIVNEKHLNDAYELFISNTYEFIDKANVKGKIEEIPQKYIDKQRRIILSELGTKYYLNINELFEKVKGFFKNILELQIILDNLEKESIIYQPKQGYYSLMP